MIKEKLNNELEKIRNCSVKGESSILYPTNITPIKGVENNFYVKIEKLTYKLSNGKYRYYEIIQCKTCGRYKKITGGDWPNFDNRECKHCKAERHRRELIGFENIAYTVLDFDEEMTAKHPTKNGSEKLYYKVKCKKCGAEISVRKDAILSVSKEGCCKCCGNNVIPTIEAPNNVLYGRYKANANSRGLSFELSKDEFSKLTKSNCYYCGASPVEHKSLKRYNKTVITYVANGIDRINSNKGYTLDNVVSCCTMCNRMKLHYTKEDFLEHVDKIYNHIKVQRLSNDSEEENQVEYTISE